MAPRIPKQNTRFINPQAEARRGMSALEALRGYAGAPSQASVMYPGSQQGYEAGELAGMAEMLIPGAAMAKGALGAALAGVVKPRGGNWISGDVESSIENLFRKEYRPESLQLQRDALEIGRQRGYGEDMIRELERAVQQRETPIALNRWIEGPLTKYIKRDMATPEDPVRRLADEGILHMGIPQTIGASSLGVQAARKLAGFPEEGLSITPGGSLWENLSDRVINSGPARYLQEEPKMMAENPWMQKLDPESTVYNMPSSIERGLGLDHLVDELSNAMNPESGLPRNLLLRPEQMQQMGMEKAVRHVDAINKWRAAQQAAANAELANKAMILREYPDTPEMPNPKGLRWMELSPDEELAKMYKEGIPSGAENAQRYKEKLSALEKQLKYEGDTMGHCVGGYCEDVLAGGSRIFSLRDAKGEPHVTVEVGPGLRPDIEELVDAANRSGDSSWFEKEFDRINGLGAFQLLDEEMLESGLGEDLWDFAHYALQKHPETMAQWAQPSIKQIKGKQNLAPKDEYLPFVQDFVRNNPLGGEWGSVGDLGNTQLRDLSELYGSVPDGVPRFIGPGETKRLYDERPDLRGWFDEAFDAGFWEPDFAEGGLVAQPDYFDDLDAFLRR